MTSPRRAGVITHSNAEFVVGHEAVWVWEQEGKGSDSSHCHSFIHTPTRDGDYDCPWCQRAHSLRPLVDLLHRAKGIGEHEASYGVPKAGSTVRIELTTAPDGVDVHLREVTDTCDLDVVRGLHEVDAWR